MFWLVGGVPACGTPPEIFEDYWSCAEASAAAVAARRAASMLSNVWPSIENTGRRTARKRKLAPDGMATPKGSPATLMTMGLAATGLSSGVCCIENCSIDPLLTHDSLEHASDGRGISELVRRRRDRCHIRFERGHHLERPTRFPEIIPVRGAMRPSLFTVVLPSGWRVRQIRCGSGRFESCRGYGARPSGQICGGGKPHSI